MVRSLDGAELLNLSLVGYGLQFLFGVNWLLVLLEFEKLGLGPKLDIGHSFVQ